MILKLNDKYVDMYSDTSVSGSFKPISLSTDDDETNPHSAEFKIPLTENNKSIIEYDDDTNNFKSEDISAVLMRDDGEISLIGFAYVSIVEINKLETSISVQIVDTYTYLIKKASNMYIGDLLKNNQYRYISSRCVNLKNISNNPYFSYIYKDTTGFDQFIDSRNETYTYVSNAKGDGEIPIAIKPLKFIKDFFKSNGVDTVDTSGLNNINESNLATIIPISKLVSPRLQNKDLIVYIDGTFRGISSGQFNDATIASKQSAGIKVFGNDIRMVKTSETSPKMYSFNVVDDRFKFYEDGFKIDGLNQNEYSSNRVYGIIKSVFDNKFKINIKPNQFDERLSLTIYDFPRWTCSTGFVALILNINGNSYKLATGKIDDVGGISLKTVDYKLFNEYEKIVELKAGEPIEFRLSLVATSEVIFTDASGAKIRWFNDTLDQLDDNKRNKMCVVEVKRVIGSAPYMLYISDFSDESTLNQLTNSGAVFNEDRLVQINGLYPNKTEALKDIYAIDMAETLNSSNIKLDDFIRDFVSRFNIKIYNQGYAVVLKHNSDGSGDKVILSDIELNGSVTISKNSDETPIRSIVLKNNDFGMKYDKYNDDYILGSSDEFIVNKDYKDKKEKSFNSSIVPDVMYGDYNVISDDVASVLSVYKSQESVGVTPYKPYKREKYGTRYGFIVDNDKKTCPMEFVLSKNKPYLITNRNQEDMAESYKLLNASLHYPQRGLMAETFYDAYNGSNHTIRIDNGTVNGIVKPCSIRNGVVVVDMGTITAGSSFRINKYISDQTNHIVSGISIAKIGKIAMIELNSVEETRVYLNPVQGGAYLDLGGFVKTGRYYIYLSIENANIDFNRQHSVPVKIDGTEMYGTDRYIPAISSNSTINNKEVTLSFNNRIVGDTYQNALYLFFKDINTGIYTQDSLFIEASFFMTPNDIYIMQSGADFMYNGQQYGLVEANDIDLYSPNGGIVKLKLYKK